jgi:hypothetical protein
MTIYVKTLYVLYVSKVRDNLYNPWISKPKPCVF